MIYEIKERIPKKFLAVKIENTDQCRKDVKEAFKLNLDDLVDVYAGKWFVANTDDIGTIRVIDHDSINAEFILADNELMHNHEAWINWLSPKKLKMMIESLGPRRTLITSYDALDDVERLYKEFEFVLPSKSGDGQFTGGFYQEEYERDNKIYVFSFDNGNAYQLEVYEKESE